MLSLRKSTDCVVTVFLAISFALIVSLILALVESAHVSAVRYQMTIASDAAIDSLFSNYHNELWNRYRLVLYEMNDRSETERQLTEYMRPYAEAENWYRFQTDNVNIIRADAVTCCGGEFFEQEVLDYMDYAVAANLVEKFSDNDASMLWDDLKEAQSMKEVTDDYAEESKEAVAMEKSLEKVANNLERQRTERNEAERAWNSGNWGGFRSHAESLMIWINNLPGQIDDYSAKADNLSIKLDECEARNAEKMNELRSDSRELMDETIRQYRDYADADSQRRIEIESLDDSTDSNIAFIDALIEESYNLEAEEEAAEAEEAARISSEVDGEVEGTDSRTTEDTREGAGGGSGFTIPACEIDRVFIGKLNCQYGMKDEETEGVLESAKSTLAGGILQLVLPEGRTVSDKVFSLSDLPSHKDKESRVSSERNVIESLLIGEYASTYMRDFTDGVNDTLTDSDGYPVCELEYVLAGESSDKKNLAAAVGRVYAIREGMNYLHIMRDPQKRNEVKALATAIVGGLGLPVLIPLMECLIIGVWAGAESVIDVRALLSGQKVAMYKSASEWKTGLSGMIAQLKKTGGGRTKNTFSGDTSGDARGITYETYLKYLLLLISSDKRNYRMMDVVQMNIQKTGSSFYMSNCIYGMEAEISCEAKGVFADIPTFNIKTKIKKAY